MSKISPEERIAEYKEKAVAAKAEGDLQAAADWYFKAARLADFESASEYVRIAFPRLYEPIRKPKKATADGKKIYEWHSYKLIKLDKKLRYEPSKEVKFQKRLEAYQKMAAKYDHPMMDKYFGDLYWAHGGIKGEAETYFKKAAERGDYVAAGKLIFAYGKNVYNARKGNFTCVQDMEEFWKYVFLTYEISKQRYAWFTQGSVGVGEYEDSGWMVKPYYQATLLNKMAEYMCDSVVADMFPDTPPAQEGPDENAVKKTDYGTRDICYDYATLTEEDKESLFLWFCALCNTFPDHERYKKKRWYLCYMYSEGYGCEPDIKKARQIVKDVPMRDHSLKNALDTYDRYDHDYKDWRVKPIVAYFLAEDWVEKGENLEQAKAWLTRVTTDSMWEKYRIAAQELLDKLG